MQSQDILASRAPRATILLRLLVGAVFLSEGIQKFLYPDELGVGRFARTDWSMLLGSLFLLIVGAGPWSIDARLSRGAEATAAASPRRG